MIEGGGAQAELRAIAEGVNTVEAGGVPAGLPANVHIDEEAVAAHRLAEAADMAEVAAQVADANAEVNMYEDEAEAIDNANVAAIAAENNASAADNDMIIN